MGKTRRQVPVFVLLFGLLFVAGLFAQETTGGLQGTVKDPSGAIVQGAKVGITGPTLVGVKEAVSDSNGYYRFANLPPATYTITVTAQGFTTLKREGVTIEVGHLPTLDLPMQVGAGSTVVEVTEEAPLIDVTTTRTMTNITQDVIQDVPHGRSFQSVIEFAPSARNEPLQGSNRLGTGTGGDSPGNGSNGGDHGFSVAGGADSENSYLVEGQETANIIGGYSHTNVPFDFIQEVQVKTSGIEAEHGGALGGVANVIMKKGTSGYHGSIFSTYENGSFDGSPTGYERKDPNGLYQTNPTTGALQYTDQPYQNYQPVRPKTSDVFPGFTFGGPLIPKWKDKAYFFIGFNPEFNRFESSVNYAAGAAISGLPNTCPTSNGICKFSQNTNTYYSTARVDVAATQKIRVFGSWLYQYQRQNGDTMPNADSVNGLYNVSTANAPSSYAHTLGYTAPNLTINTGMDWTINQHLVSTTRFGYYFENYANFGFPTNGVLNQFVQNGVGGTDLAGNPLPATLAQPTGTINGAYNSTFTNYNANKAIQLDQDIAWYKSGWGGTHNFKFGYQLNRLSNLISQSANEPVVNIDPGAAQVYTPLSSTGIANCAAIQAANGASQCTGNYGYIELFDSGNGGKATSYNHAFFAQDAWTIGSGVTINAGVRVEHENLPGEFDSVGVAHPPSGFPANPISFGWGSKIAPRIGAAWDVFKDGRMKVFGSYGQFYDIMKLNLAISSFGGQYWDSCFYALNTANLSSILPAFDSAHRFCPNDTTGAAGGNFPGGVPAGLSFIENVNYRISTPTCSTCNPYQEGVAPGLKPYEQHESVFGVDYQLSKGLAIEARWDRRRLDHAIEDSAIENAQGNETFVIVNPGFGVNRTFQGFCQYLYAKDPSPTADCANSAGANPNFGIIPAARSYDGVEFRLTKAQSNHWFGMFSYTYSKFRGNYTGLTSSELADGGLAGRNSPNNSRAFDEPYFSYNASGGSSSGLLPTDRPNAFKGYAYYELGWLKHFSTDFGIFQYAYSGSPQSTYVDAGAGRGAWAIYPFNRGEWANFTQDPNTGAVTFGAPYVNRTPWYTQTDFNITQNYKISESKALSFSAIFTNLLNQHTVTALYSQLDSNYVSNYIRPNGLFIGNGVDFYQQIMSPFSLAYNLNHFKGTAPGNNVVQLNSAYGQPMFYQVARNIRLGVKFTF